MQPALLFRPLNAMQTGRREELLDPRDRAAPLGRERKERALPCARESHEERIKFFRAVWCKTPPGLVIQAIESLIRAAIASHDKAHNYSEGRGLTRRAAAPILVFRATTPRAAIQRVIGRVAETRNRRPTARGSPDR